MGHVTSVHTPSKQLKPICFFFLRNEEIYKHPEFLYNSNEFFARSKEDVNDYIREHKKLVQKAKTKQQRASKHQARLNISRSKRSFEKRLSNSFSDATDLASDDDHSFTQTTPSPLRNDIDFKYCNDIEKTSVMNGIDAHKGSFKSKEPRYFTYDLPKDPEIAASLRKQPLVIPKVIITSEWMDESENDVSVTRKGQNCFTVGLPSPGFLSPLQETSEEDDEVFLP